MYNADIFSKAKDIIKGLGYDVYTTRFEHVSHKPTYGYIKSKDGSRVSYFQSDDFGFGIRFSVPHKPAYGIGSGISIKDKTYHLEDLTTEVIEDTFKVHFPYRCGSLMKERIVENQYKDFNEWKESETYAEVIEL